MALPPPKRLELGFGVATAAAAAPKVAPPPKAGADPKVEVLPNPEEAAPKVGAPPKDGDPPKVGGDPKPPAVGEAAGLTGVLPPNAPKPCDEMAFPDVEKEEPNPPEAVVMALPLPPNND